MLLPKHISVVFWRYFIRAPYPTADIFSQRSIERVKNVNISHLLGDSDLERVPYRYTRHIVDVDSKSTTVTTKMLAALSY